MNMSGILNVTKNVIAIGGAAFGSAIVAEAGFDAGTNLVNHVEKGYQYYLFKQGKAPVIKKGLFGLKKYMVNPITGELVKVVVK